jgi:hypothetical protein
MRPTEVDPRMPPPDSACARQPGLAGSVTAGRRTWPVFHQPWWLDAVSPGNWDAVTVERGGETAARLPFIVRGPRRLRMLTQPPATPFLGPWVARSPDAKYAKALSDEMELQAELESRLPAAAMFRQSFSTAVINVLPFIWAGYRAEVAYTHRLEDLSSEAALWDGLSGNIRREIRKARKQVVVRDDLGLDEFYGVWHETLTRQGRPAPSRDRLERIEAACAARDARVSLFACDGADRIHAVAYIVWDADAAYYLLGGSRPELRTSGAASLVLWEAILRARQVSRVFDFEGSMIAPINRFFRAFGGRQAPYLCVSRATRIASGALGMRNVARRGIAALGRGRSEQARPAAHTPPRACD